MANRSRWICSSIAGELRIVASRRARETKPRIQLVDLAVGRDARVGLGHARAVEQAGLSRYRRSWCKFSLVDDYNRAAFEGRLDRSEARFRSEARGSRSEARAEVRPAVQCPLRVDRRSGGGCSTWYRRNGRDLPWRRTTDPYHILVSEVMLQQTQVDRVLPKYARVAREVPEARGARRRAGGRRHRDLAAARLQHPAAPAARDRARVGRALRRRSCLPTRRRCDRSRASASTPPAR